MKTRKLFTLLMAAVLLVASLGLTVHADVDSYAFAGSCQRFFTTSKYLEQKDKNWPSYATVTCTELSFNGSPSYEYGWTVLVTADGAEYGNRSPIYYGEYNILAMPSNYAYTTIKARMIHPDYKSNGTTSTSSMHIAGNVKKTNLG